jgi:hypothetical protein
LTLNHSCITDTFSERANAAITLTQGMVTLKIPPTFLFHFSAVNGSLNPQQEPLLSFLFEIKPNQCPASFHYIPENNLLMKTWSDLCELSPALCG